MLKWVLEINFISPFLDIISGTATLINSDFKLSTYEKIIILEIKKESGSTSFKTKEWKKGYIHNEEIHDFLRDHLNSYHDGLKLEKECHFWLPNYLQKEDINDLSKIKENKTSSKKKTKSPKSRKKEIRRITKNKK